MEFLNSFNKIALVVEYDGRYYHGFQWQTNLPTIQAELEQAIRKLTGESNRVIAASRTDAGVHARGQVVSFRTKSTLPPQTFIRALNYYLPNDIAVKNACKVDTELNVRREALSREYEYKILNSSVRSPLARSSAYQVTKELDIEFMNKACQFLKGKHDFTSFAAASGRLGSTMRNVYEANMTRENNLVTFHIIANAFLTHQVRNTVGLLIRVGLGKVGLEEFRQTMEAKTPGIAGPTAPAYGLCLTKINFPSSLELKT